MMFDSNYSPIVIQYFCHIRIYFILSTAQKKILISHRKFASKLFICFQLLIEFLVITLIDDIVSKSKEYSL